MQPTHNVIIKAALAAAVLAACFIHASCVTGQIRFTDPKSGLQATVEIPQDSGK